MTTQGVMLQFFHWHSRGDGTLWSELAQRAEELQKSGFTSLWIPPCCKGAGGIDDRGYTPYDLFDLGEFDQKGSVRTRYGTRAQLLDAIATVRARGLRVYADIVLNHRGGADEKEDVAVRVVNEAQRNQVEHDTLTIPAWTRFTFKARNAKYSSMIWDKRHFIAVDCNADNPSERKIYLLADKTFSGDVSFERENYDFLMGCDVDMYDHEVRGELARFGKWFVETTQVDGFRLDGLKHIPASCIKDWLGGVRGEFASRELWAVGEYWTTDVRALSGYLGTVDHSVQLFDVPLHFRMREASQRGNAFDMRTIFDGSLVQREPQYAVTFVDNHDTQPGSTLESWVEDWFKPLAYALILLRKDGYPCVFYPDYFGHDGSPGPLTSHRTLIDCFMNARIKYAYGEQRDAFDHPSCIGFMRTGNAEHPGAMIVLMSNGDAGTKRFETGLPHASFRDATGHLGELIQTDEHGAAEFRCPGRSVSVWLQQ